MTGGPWTRSVKVVHGPLVHVLSSPSFSRFRCCVFEFWMLRFRDLGASYFGLRFRVLRFRNYLSFWPHAHPKSKQYVFHLCSGQGSDPYCFFPVNPFVDETDSSFEKKKDLHAHQTSFRQKRMAKNKLTETTHSLSSATCVPGS